MEAENKRTLKVAVGSFIIAVLFGISLFFIPRPFDKASLALVLIAAWLCISHITMLLVNWEVDGKL